MKNTLHLVLTGKWYDMIESGEKTEEYRRICPYWDKRLDVASDHYEKVTFHRGYTNTCCSFSCQIERGISNRREWGAPEETCYIIRLEKRIDEITELQ